VEAQHPVNGNVPRRHARPHSAAAGNGGRTMRSHTVLITGCSSGIGRATALALHDAGHRVVATARRPETLDDLPPGIVRLRLDVCDPASVEAAVRDAGEKTGGITALVNNAGYGQSGPVEFVTEDQVRAQFETNVYGPLRLIRALLPSMRARGEGRIINVSSAAGRFSTPFLGIYCASKFALEAVSDALRVEVAPFGVKVVLIEPGPIETNFGDTAMHSVVDEVLEDGSNPYHSRAVRVTNMPDALKVFTKDAESVARAIERALTADRPRSRYTVTLPAKLTPLTQLLPDKLLDTAQSRLLGS
jgi:NAD(P)-dependent dehydrogenase (short-subunit alcohol dehydrogenase family)